LLFGCAERAGALAGKGLAGAKYVSRTIAADQEGGIGSRSDWAPTVAFRIHGADTDAVPVVLPSPIKDQGSGEPESQVEEFLER